MDNLYAEEKAALLLMTLNPRDAESVLERMGAEQGQRLRAQIQRLEHLPGAHEHLDEVLQEFNRYLLQVDAGLIPAPAAEPADVDYQVKQPTPNESPPTEPMPTPPPATDALPAPLNGSVAELRQLSADKLSLALQGELPRTAALVLDSLDVNQAGEVLKRLPAPMREEVSLQLGRSVPVDPEVLQCVACAVLRKSQLAEERPPALTEQARFKKMADILRLLPKVDRLAVVAALDQHDGTLASGVKELLYQFEDLLRIEDRSMQKLLAEVDSKNLAVSLKGAPDAIKDKVMNNLSKRARETLAEEMEFTGTVSAAQIEEARKVIVDMIQRLDQAGELVMTE